MAPVDNFFHFALKTGSSSVPDKGNFTPAKRWLVAAAASW